MLQIRSAAGVRGADIMPWVEEALDSIEFVTGPADRWGIVPLHPSPPRCTSEVSCSSPPRCHTTPASAAARPHRLHARMQSAARRCAPPLTVPWHFHTLAPFDRHHLEMLLPCIPIPGCAASGGLCALQWATPSPGTSPG